MRNSTRIAVIAVAFLSGVSIAAAAGSTMLKENTAKSTSTSILKDRLTLSSKQEKIVWQDISKQATKEKAPAHFAAKTGVVVPGALLTHPVPMTVSNKVPELRRYQYALLANNRLLIINPNDNKVAEVLTR